MLNLRDKFWFVVLSCICRLIFATTFIVSGFLKSIDPWGTILTIESYLAAYNIMSIPEWLIVIGAVTLGALEMIVGLMLLFNLYTRIASVASVAIMLFFTILTLLSATIVPVEDCGCFGELIKLTPWQTFAKNVVLLPMAICFWYHYRKEQLFDYGKRELILLTLFVTLSFGLCIYCYRHLPIIDNSPYREGVNVAVGEEGSSVESANEKIVLVYRNRQTDELHEFSVEDTTWQNDTLWEWVETRIDSVNDKAPALLEFFVRDAEGDRTQELLAKPKLFMLFMDRVEFGHDIRAAFDKVEQYADVNGGEVVYITPEELSLVTTKNPCYNMDPKTMKTILRADYGLVVLEKGVIAEKYNYRDIPY